MIDRLLCFLAGHNWNIEPPWNEMELRNIPYCKMCGKTYVEIVEEEE